LDTITVQAPQPPSAHPSLVPVRPTANINVKENSHTEKKQQSYEISVGLNEQNCYNVQNGNVQFQGQ